MGRGDSPKLSTDRSGDGKGTIPSSAVRALRWLRSQEAWRGGIRVHPGRRDAYPEVTGYLIPTLLDYGESRLAARCIRWLLRIQRSDGGYLGSDGVPYPFDTGQVLRGLLAAGSLSPASKDAARRAADCLYGQMVKEGQGGFGMRYKAQIPEPIHLYALGPLYEAARRFGEDRYRAAADRCLDFYLHHEEALRLRDLTHFLAYELEALIDLGHAEAALPIMDLLRQRQRTDGSIPGREGEEWICTPGLAQLAVCWYKLDRPEPANRAMEWLEAHQTPAGGFLGSYGRGASYFPQVELPWASKFFLDACRMRPRGPHLGAPQHPEGIERDEY